MPRKARKKSLNGIYHIVLRGINKQTIFEDDHDRWQFLKTVTRYKEVCGFELYAFCLMDNHVHLLLKEVDETVSQSMKRICSSYVHWYNRKYDRCGHLFQERFSSENVDDARYFLAVLRYIHQNPLKAGLVRCVWDAHWTSVHEYARKPDMIDVERGLHLFSMDPTVALMRYVAYMEKPNTDECLDYVERVKLSDEEVKAHLRAMGISSNSVIQQMPREDRDTVLGKLKKTKGISVRQISRVTGVSKSVIGRIP